MSDQEGRKSGMEKSARRAVRQLFQLIANAQDNEETRVRLQEKGFTLLHQVASRESLPAASKVTDRFRLALENGQHHGWGRIRSVAQQATCQLEQIGIRKEALRAPITKRTDAAATTRRSRQRCRLPSFHR